MAFARSVAVTVTHTKTLIAPDSGSEDKVYGSDYVASNSHTGSGTESVSGATSGGIPYFSSATSEACSALLAQYGVVIGGGAGAAPATNSGLTFGGAAAGTGLAIAAGTATTDVAAGSWSTTWNNAAVTFTGAYRYSVTDQAANAGSGSGSIHSIWQGGPAGATTIMSLGKNGSLNISGSLGGVNIPQSNPSVAGYMINSGASSWGMWQQFNSTAYFGVNFAAKLAMDAAGIYVLSNGRFNFSSSTSDPYATQSNFNQISAGVIGVGTTAANSLGSIRGKYQSSDGTAGVASFGPSAVASITVKDGIITAIS